MEKKELEYLALVRENQFMKDNIIKLRNQIDEKDTELQMIKSSRGYKYLEILRKLKRSIRKK